MTVFGCLAAVVAMALAYLCSANQRLLPRRPGRLARVAAWAFTVLAVGTWVVSEGALPGIVSGLTALMLGAVALPYIAWLLRPASDRRPR